MRRVNFPLCQSACFTQQSRRLLRVAPATVAGDQEDARLLIILLHGSD